mgnify:CR=1 FL=1
MRSYLCMVVLLCCVCSKLEDGRILTLVSYQDYALNKVGCRDKGYAAFGKFENVVWCF